MWYLIVSIPDICNLITLLNIENHCFTCMVRQIHFAEPQLNRADSVNTEPHILFDKNNTIYFDLHNSHLICFATVCSIVSVRKLM